ncbi:hypothetical protein [Neptuniibacter sp. QD37_11]|uniref:hypothetical protein n=1 Tax=Neptuniibacter sp. QD37_11 TaxID=3398209 RepID=UPI0039F4CA82
MLDERGNIDWDAIDKFCEENFEFTWQRTAIGFAAIFLLCVLILIVGHLLK